MTTSCSPGRTTTTASTATGSAGWSAPTWASPATAPSPPSRTARSTRRSSNWASCPTELGEPELGDKVVKSGRTTGVTHGIVRRVDTIAKIDYGGTVGRPEHRLLRDRARPRPPGAGGRDQPGRRLGRGLDVHQGRPAPDRSWPGCTSAGRPTAAPTSTPWPACRRRCSRSWRSRCSPPAAEEVEAVGGGYDRDFLGDRIDVPAVGAALRDDVAATVDGQQIVPYTHFSLQMKASRRFAFWVAWNIDGGAFKALSRSGIQFVKDPRIPDDLQIGDELYANNDLDRGHLARRADLLWGSLPEREEGQHRLLLLHQHHPADGRLQPEHAGRGLGPAGGRGLRRRRRRGPEGQRVRRAGLPDDDRVYRGVQLPREYWKVIAFRERGQLKARAFLLTQNLDQLEALELDEFRVFQTSLAELEARTGLTFPDVLRDADTLAVPEALDRRAPLEGTDDIQW